ncbi:MAG: hypothetical protein WAU44_16325 [Nitrospira sp.]|jgi:hypothetical protein|uniref:hypothetical protein n=1 Tax=Nitrospira sp. ND1 TaxID=1658518 RepID=UPI0009BBAC0C|nr:hypothetical protein [Nitrospira sp. ND1]MBK7421390.1 hypothetical protein [Nitrospira sp.]OYT23314.1 MAG: hypothetical protein CCU27_09950 [Nitrospira sp. UW-LDO-02]MBK7487652.1 hypothetical protein [Nitrospira sp.]MBP6198135.1 hypothetical protein [Nitrospira sp.]MBP6205749.1 hypothetical protein [Nitrospira sp.]
MQSINLPDLRAQFAGTRLRELVQHHLRRQSQRRRIDGLQATINLLPEVARGVAEGFIDRWNAHVYDQEFWERDTSEVFDDIIADARTVLRPLDLETDDEAAFNLFNIVVMNYAYSAYDQPKMREFMGILGGSFPWPSALGLLYPITAIVYVGTATPAGAAMVVGYGIANLGYLLFVAGVFGGTFQILGLNNRWQVFAAAVAAFLLGTLLSNVGG